MGNLSIRELYASVKALDNYIDCSSVSKTLQELEHAEIAPIYNTIKNIDVDTLKAYCLKLAAARDIANICYNHLELFEKNKISLN